MDILASHKWQLRFLRMAYQTASWSKDASTQVGCVIVTPNGKPRSFGFNGMPMGVDDTLPERHERPEKYLWFEHAERNAFYLADRSLAGCILFSTHILCPDCARGAIQKEIAAVVIDRYNGTDSDFWKEKHPATLTMLSEAGIKLFQIYSDVKLEKTGTELYVVPR